MYHLARGMHLIQARTGTECVGIGFDNVANAPPQRGLAQRGSRPGGQSSTEQDSRHSKGQPTPSASMTGCVDEQDGRYVLVDEKTLSPTADLVAEGFPTEAFAKHVGHKVTVRGASSAGGARPVFRVRSIETISDTCAPKTSVQQGMN